MNHFEHTLATFPNSPESKNSKRAHESFAKETQLVLGANNTKVEKRYNYFVNSR